jgi:transposase-like protein
MMHFRSPKMKKRTRRGDPQKQTYWEGVVRRSRESGQSVRAFCRAEGLRESAFYFWRRRLARGGQRSRKGVPEALNGERPRARSAMPALRSPRRDRPTPSFLPVQVVASANRCSDVGQAAWGVEIVLACGRTVRIQAGFDRQTLAEVLAVLEGRPC